MDINALCRVGVLITLWQIFPLSPVGVLMLALNVGIFDLSSSSRIFGLSVTKVGVSVLNQQIETLSVLSIQKLTNILPT
jgi:hypothetical protein